MSLEVFLAFSPRDINAAEETCAALERAGFACWMVHRDFPPGSDHVEATLKAIDQCRAVVVIFSSKTNTSNTYALEQAARQGASFIWLALDDTAAIGELKHFQDSALVIDASTPPLKAHLRKLVLDVGRALGPGLRTGLPANPVEEDDAAMRTAGDVISELSARRMSIQKALTEAPAAERLEPKASVRPGPPRSSPIDFFRQLPSDYVAPEPPTRARVPRSKSNRKRMLGRKALFAIVSLAVLAFAGGALFSKQVLWLTNVIAALIAAASSGWL